MTNLFEKTIGNIFGFDIMKSEIKHQIIDRNGGKYGRHRHVYQK